jgi:CheY-like chemotaxis protein
MKRRQTILLAEDDEDAVLLLKMACARSRLINPMQVVGDGEKAIAYLGGQGIYGDRIRFPLPCLLLLDLKMPNKSGFDVLSWLRAYPAVHLLPVVVLTSSADPSDIDRAYDLGANSYAVKPAAFDNFIDLLNRLESWWIGVNENPLLGQ